jgi:hypothetical protein
MISVKFREFVTGRHGVVRADCQCMIASGNPGTDRLRAWQATSGHEISHENGQNIC